MLLANFTKFHLAISKGFDFVAMAEPEGDNRL